jgi:hypothetical protein
MKAATKKDPIVDQRAIATELLRKWRTAHAQCEKVPMRETRKNVIRRSAVSLQLELAKFEAAAALRKLPGRSLTIGSIAYDAYGSMIVIRPLTAAAYKRIKKTGLPAIRSMSAGRVM